MKHKSERYKSRRVTPWDDQIEKTPTQEFVTKVTMEHYNQRHRSCLKQEKLNS